MQVLAILLLSFSQCLSYGQRIKCECPNFIGGIENFHDRIKQTLPLNHITDNRYSEIDTTQQDSNVYEIFNVTEIATFKTGYEDLMHFIDSSYNYPKEASDICLKAYINISFIVEKDGKVSNIEALGKKIGYGLEEEAIRVISLTSGHWTAAKLRGSQVRMRFRVPIRIVY